MKTIINEYNKDHKMLMRSIHKGYYVDFNKPYAVYEIQDHFTLRSIKPLYTAGGFTSENAVILVILEGVHTWDRDRMYGVEIEDTRRGYTIDIIGYDYHGMDNYYTQGDFNEARKTEGVQGFIFCQLREYLTQPKEYAEDQFTRHPLNRAQWDKYDRVYHETTYHHYYHETREYDISGYRVDDRRAWLSTKAEQIRTEKKRSEYLASPQDNKIKILEDKIKTYREIIIHKVKTAVTADDFYNLHRIFDSYTNESIVDALRDFETFKKKTMEKSFSSLADSDRYYESVLEKIS